MTEQVNDSDRRPDPEMLAAYADGELSPAECRLVEDWLARHPDLSRRILLPAELTKELIQVEDDAHQYRTPMNALAPR